MFLFLFGLGSLEFDRKYLDQVRKYDLLKIKNCSVKSYKVTGPIKVGLFLN